MKALTEITPSSIILQSGKQIHSDPTVWTTGIKGCNIKTTPQIERSKTGRIFVDKYSRVNGFENVFAIGDISIYSSRWTDSTTACSICCETSMVCSKNIVSIFATRGTDETATILVQVRYFHLVRSVLLCLAG